MSADALRSVLSRLPVSKRLQLAGLDEELCQLASRFHDVDSLLLDEESVSLGGKTAVSQIGPIQVFPDKHQLAVIFAQCPAVLRVFVQKKLSPAELQEFGGKADTLQKLYISTENFLNAVGGWEGLQFTRLKSLGVLCRQDQAFKLSHKIGASALTPVLSPSLRRLVLTGVVLLPDALTTIFSLPNLRSLDLIGTLVDSKEAALILPTLKSPPQLQEVSLPPSLFSFSKTSEVKFDLKWLKSPKICLYVEYFYEETFFRDLEKMFDAVSLKALVLYGNVIRLQESPRISKHKKPQILFGPNCSQLIDVPFPGKDCTLVCHRVLHSPYTQQELLRLRGESWKIDLSTATDDPPVRAQREPAQAGMVRMFLNGLGHPMPLLPPPRRNPSVGRLVVHRGEPVTPPAAVSPILLEGPPPGPPEPPGGLPPIEPAMLDAFLNALLRGNGPDPPP